MSYEAKTDWKYDDIVTEKDLNRIEQGVQDAQEKADQASARAGQAEDNSKAYTDQQIQLVTETGIPKLVTYPFVLTAKEEGQTDFLIPLETFDRETDTILVVQNSTVLSTERFSVVDEKTVRLSEGVQVGTKIFIQVFKNVPLGPEGAINGGVIAVNSLPSDRVQGFDELFTFVSDGKSKLETAITDKNGIVSKQDNVATFDELGAGIRSIPQAKGNAERTDVLAGRTFSSESAGIEQEGRMVNRGAVSNTIITQNGQFIIPQGYHNGNGKVIANFLNLVPENVRIGVRIGGVLGTLQHARYLSGTIPSFSTYGNGGGSSVYKRVIDLPFVPKILLVIARRTWTEEYLADIATRQNGRTFRLTYSSRGWSNNLSSSNYISGYLSDVQDNSFTFTITNSEVDHVDYPSVRRDTCPIDWIAYE